MGTRMKGNGTNRAGFIVSAELVLIATVMLFGLMIGLVAVRDGLIGELRDIGQAVGRLNQGLWIPRRSGRARDGGRSADRLDAWVRVARSRRPGRRPNHHCGHPDAAGAGGGR